MPSTGALAGGHGIVVDHAGALERPRRCIALGTSRVDPVPIPQKHMRTLNYWFMGTDTEVRTGRHCVFAMHAHLVFVTKFRHQVFTDHHLTRMEQIMRDVCTD